jgi:alanine-glyoxylate transaminase/serine-glyoxylate transaminase/serine-pyruvate transaminase
MHLKLMIPGPIELEADVLEQMGAPNHVHYGDDWLAVHNETIALLKRVFRTEGRIFMMPGSGSLALDAAVHSTFAPGDHVILGINGHFGHRLCEILSANGVRLTVVEAAPETPLDPDAFARALDAAPDAAAVALVHLETSTAVLNPLRAVAALARERGVLCMADAVSSLAGADVRMDEWGVDLCMAGSQKGLGGAAGLGIVAAGPRAWERISEQADACRSWYLDLRRWDWYADNWADWHPFPVTMPTAVILGLRAALQSLFADGLEARFARYDRLARRLRDGLKALDMALFVPEMRMSSVLTAAWCPEGVTSGELVRYLETEHHIKITGGFGPYKDRVVRIGHMGGAMSEADIDDLLEALRQFLAEQRTRTV